MLGHFGNRRLFDISAEEDRQDIGHAIAGCGPTDFACAGSFAPRVPIADPPLRDAAEGLIARTRDHAPAQLATAVFVPVTRDPFDLRSCNES